MQSLKLLLHRQEIAQRIEALARQIEDDYQRRAPLLLGVLKGAFIFLSDLARQLKMPVEIDFVRLASYGMGTQSAGQVEFLLEPRLPLAGRDIIIVEDIVDTGLSIKYLLDYLKGQHPASVRICALLVRSSVLADPNLHIDYKGFDVGPGFVVGYGLDMGERYRALPDIYLVEGSA